MKTSDYSKTAPYPNNNLYMNERDHKTNNITKLNENITTNEKTKIVSKILLNKEIETENYKHNKSASLKLPTTDETTRKTSEQIKSIHPTKIEKKENHVTQTSQKLSIKKLNSSLKRDLLIKSKNEITAELKKLSNAYLKAGTDTENEILEKINKTNDELLKINNQINKNENDYLNKTESLVIKNIKLLDKILEKYEKKLINKESTPSNIKNKVKDIITEIKQFALDEINTLSSEAEHIMEKFGDRFSHEDGTELTDEQLDDLAKQLENDISQYILASPNRFGWMHDDEADTRKAEASEKKQSYNLTNENRSPNSFTPVEESKSATTSYEIPPERLRDMLNTSLRDIIERQVENSREYRDQLAEEKRADLKHDIIKKEILNREILNSEMKGDTQKIEILMELLKKDAIQEALLSNIKDIPMLECLSRAVTLILTLEKFPGVKQTPEMRALVREVITTLIRMTPAVGVNASTAGGLPKAG